MRAIRLTRIVPAPRERVWRAWTDDSEMTRWFWPQRLSPVCFVDLREGGRWSVVSDALGMTVSGEFLVIEPLKRLHYSWRWNDELDDTRVTVTFDNGIAHGLATTVNVIHTGFVSEHSAEEHEIGWSDCLDRLPAAILAEQSAGPET
jgi:uncharacterized protein YndB with AHSA1/START domain